MPEPTINQLNQIKSWPDDDLQGLMAFIKPMWEYADSGYWEENADRTEFILHTAGWSDNEEIIECMQLNVVWWLMFWQSSTRGGHFSFVGKDVTFPSQTFEGF